MATNPLFIPLFTLEEVILDKDTGEPLAGGIVEFYRDLQRDDPAGLKPVYEITGDPPDYTFASVGSTFTLALNGTFVDGDGNNFAPYAFPYDADGNLDLYFVRVTSAGGVPQFTRESVPYVGSGGVAPSQRTNTENELCNPQFVEVLFPTPGTTTLSVTGSNTVTAVAPGWDIVSSGTGTIALQRLEPTAADVLTNPPYILSIAASSGLGASITLRQRLYNSPSLLRGSFASGCFIANVIAGGQTLISMSFAPSAGSATEIIAGTAVSTSTYTLIQGNASIPEQVNTAASTGYVDINIVIPTSRTIGISSIQLVGTDDAIDIPFDEQTADRQKDHLFHYYENSLVRQQKNSMLTGWNFALNPWQFRLPASSNVANNTYTADQTIIIQQNFVASATGNNIAVGRATAANNYAFQVTAVTSANQFGMLQYIDPGIARPYWGNIVSALVNLTFSTAHTTELKFKMRLIYKAGLPNTISQTDPIASWTAGADPVPVSGYTFIIPPNDPVYTVSNVLTQNVFTFDGITLPASSNDNMTLGILLYTISNMSEVSVADTLLVRDISLVENQFALPTQTQTYGQVLRDCEYYYENSYAVGVLPGTGTLNGIISVLIPIITAGSTTSGYFKRFSINYTEYKRAVPTVKFYSQAGTADNLTVGVVDDNGGVVSAAVDAALTKWTVASATQQRTTYITNNTTGGAFYSAGAAHPFEEGFQQFHYVADARLGI